MIRMMQQIGNKKLSRMFFEIILIVLKRMLVVETNYIVNSERINTREVEIVSIKTVLKTNFKRRNEIN